uniref:Uncharacterized protein n=1 Tax=Panagrolaimus sp. JU765 TaxID=591449 RepID=A0AC34R4J1_9BILA
MSAPSKNKELWIQGFFQGPAVKQTAGKGDILLVAACQSVDQVFPDWTQTFKLNKTEFQPTDANIPLRLPRRECFKTAYQFDAPLTQFGVNNALLIGRQAVSYNFCPPKIYAAPAMKCLETAALIAQNFKKISPKICVEFGIWGESAKTDSTFLLSTKEAKTFDFPVDSHYESLVPSKLVDKCQDYKEWTARTIKTFEQILDSNDGNHVIFVMDQLAMKIVVAHCLYGTATFETDESFLNVTCVHPGCTLLLQPTLEGKKRSFKESEYPFPSFTTSRMSTTLDYDGLASFLKA